MGRTVHEMFSGHAKRVTLSLARCSAVCAERPGLMRVLRRLPDLGYDFKSLDQESLELLYAEFDEDLEEKIRNEFEADPEYLVDLRTANGVCPLCGHIGCRFIFKLQNLKGGTSIECGSECIMTYGLAVKGAETAALAKKLLEKAIRKAVKKVKIENWHKDYNFSPDYLSVVRTALNEITLSLTIDWKIQKRAYKEKLKIFKLIGFYERTKWLNTSIRWGDWRDITAFVKENDETAKSLLPYFKPWEEPQVKVRVRKEKVADPMKNVREPENGQMEMEFS